MEIDDPELDLRIAALYDDANTWADDDEFFLQLVDRRRRVRVVDLGCGTGRLTTALARAGHDVTGVDPNPAFLSLARAKPGADAVAWIRGTSADLRGNEYDVALMTSHVAQSILTDDQWHAVLADLRSVLVPGGVLAFDSRDPSARAWETWGGADAVRESTVLPDGGALHTETTMTYEEEMATFEGVFVIADADVEPGSFEPGPGLTWSRARWSYRFRTEPMLRRSLEAAGFRVAAIHGGWHGEAVGAGPGEFVVVATTA